MERMVNTEADVREILDAKYPNQDIPIFSIPDMPTYEEYLRALRHQQAIQLVREFGSMASDRAQTEEGGTAAI